MEQQVAQMAKRVDQSVAGALPKGMAAGARAAGQVGRRAARDFSGAFETDAKKYLGKVLDALPEYEPGMKLRKWDKAVAQLRADVRSLSEQKFGPELDEKTFAAAVENMRRRAQTLMETTPKNNGDRRFFDVASAEGQLGQLNELVAEARLRGAAVADELVSSFDKQMQQSLGRGVDAFPAVKLTADTSDAERKLQGLRADMVTLQGRTIGVDVSASEAFAELKRINAELQALDRVSVDIDVRTNARAAAAEMGAFIAQADSADQAVRGIGNGANFSVSRLGYLIGLGLSIGPAIIPGAAAAAAAIGAIGTAGIGAVAGLGVFSLGMSGISDTVQAMNGYAQEQAKTSTGAARANTRLANSADQVRMAQLALANTRANVADQEFDAALRVADANRRVGDARREAGEQAQDASRRVRDAQRDVTDAEQDAVEVRRSLNEAIEDATRDIQELDVALSRNSVDQEKAVTAQMRALAELRALQENPRSSQVELRTARDNYNEQTQRLKELAAKRKELTAEQEKAAKLGVEGDDRVVAARRRIADADERVRRARERHQLAEQQRVRQQQDSARRIADAQRAAADAQRDQVRQQRDGQYQLVTATHAVRQAQQSAGQAVQQSAKQSSAALDKLNQQLAEQSPAGRRFAKFIFGLKDDVKGLRDVAQTNMLPGFEQAITETLPYLPGFSRFVGKVAKSMGDLAVQAARSLGSPTWQRFFQFVDRTAVPQMELMFEVGSNMTQGMLELFMALTPFNEPIGDGLVDMSAGFAKWARELENSPGYAKFLDYVRENGPEVVEFLTQLAELGIDLVEALAPVGSVALQVLTLLADGINSLPTGLLTAFAFGLAAVALGIVGLGAVMKTVRFKRDLAEIFGPASSRMVSRYAIETGRATAETGRFQKAVATAAGFSSQTAGRITALGTAARGAATNMGGLAATSSTTLTRGLDTGGGSAFAFGEKVKDAGANVAGARGHVSQFGESLLRGPLGPQMAAIGDGAQRMGDKVKVAGGHFQGARNYMSYLADDLMRGPLGPQMAAIGDGAQRMGDKVKAGGQKLAGLRTGAEELGSALGGPVGLAIAGATIATGYYTAKAAAQEEQAKDLAVVLGQLNTQYEDLRVTGKLAGDDAAAAFQRLVSNNPELQATVVTLDGLGVSFDEMITAVNSGDPAEVVARLNEEIARTDQQFSDAKKNNSWWDLITGNSDDTGDKARQRYDQLVAMRDGFLQTATAIKTAADAQRVLTEQDRRALAVEQARAKFRDPNAQQKALAAYDANAQRIGKLSSVLSAFSASEGDATAKADVFRQMIELQNGSAQRATEATESWSGHLLTLRESVQSNSATLDINSRSGLANRDALQAAAKASQELFLEEVAAGEQIPKVTEKHNARIRSLRDEARKLGLTSKETDILIKKYGEIDPDVTTKYTTEGFTKVFDELEKLRFAQTMLELGITNPAEAEGLWRRQRATSQGLLPPSSGMGRQNQETLAQYRARKKKAQRKATGGPIVGPGTGTSDDVLMWGSDGEHVITAAEVDAAGGHEAIEVWRRSLMAGGDLPGYSTGGPVLKGGLPAYARGGQVMWPFPVNVSKTKVPTEEQALAAVFGIGSDADTDGGVMIGGNGTALGWKVQKRIIQGAIPGTQITSDYRPGDPRWHGKGRAIDMIFPDRSERRGGGTALRAFNFIASNYGARSQELIWDYSPWGQSTGIYKGKRHRFTSPTSGPGSHNDHIHWAFDDGGWMMPGMSGVNMLREPEPVFTPGQWAILEQAVGQGAGGGRGNTYQFEFANTTLTPEYLMGLQQRAEVMDRAHRPY